MDLSGLIFVALAVAWAVYLIPKALRHHDEVSRSRSVERFSHTMRVLARREPVSKRDARLVVTPGRAPSSPVVEVKGERRTPEQPLTEEQLRARRAATRKATARRRRVLSVVVGLNVVVAALAAAGVFGWVWQAIPGGLLVAWLVACRVMVKGERAVTAAMLDRTSESPDDSAAGGDDSSADDEDSDLPHEYHVARNDQGFDEPAPSAQTAVMAPVENGLWDPQPQTLPTYVDKPVARRTVRTIDLSGPDTWTSGRTEESAELARRADAERSTPDDGDTPLAANS